MQRYKSNNTLRRSLLATFLGLALSGLAYAQTVVSSPETATVKGRAPVVSRAIIDVTPSGAGGQVLVGDVLTADFDVTDADNDDIDQTATDATVQWTVDGVNVGTPSLTYTVAAADLGKTITYKLVPFTDSAITDPHQGVLTLASDIGADGSGGGTTDPGDNGEIKPAAPSALLSIAVTPTGNPVVGTTLTAVPTCAQTCIANITYQWQIETAVGSGTYTNIAGATASTYTPTKDTQKKKIKVVGSQP
ncbi:hypothetical protein LF41_736 [Lysobacter dokdonensis DS-58]|uniref:Uncharacterized protein n=1 Tax=Lysobacter dokdonensis DS-58 TaxID=1300345 RepID=A0A0A2WE05_9GAMM|nr:ZirU family protein [Lysobacter dokdonensis]KGQ18441.1 hypothetical protein LF41_736 [Lysobacter dokdonensis DS-58]